jgi:hypothetical protein
MMETNQIHHLPSKSSVRVDTSTVQLTYRLSLVKITYRHPSHAQPLLATSTADIPVFVHAGDKRPTSLRNGQHNALRGSVSLKDVLKVICRAS